MIFGSEFIVCPLRLLQNFKFNQEYIYHGSKHYCLQYKLSKYIIKQIREQMAVVVNGGEMVQGLAVLIIEANAIDPDQTALIWLHIVCNISFQSTLLSRLESRLLAVKGGERVIGPSCFDHGSRQYEPRSDCSYGSSLIGSILFAI